MYLMGNGGEGHIHVPHGEWRRGPHTCTSWGMEGRVTYMYLMGNGGEGHIHVPHGEWRGGPHTCTSWGMEGRATYMYLIGNGGEGHIHVPHQSWGMDHIHVPHQSWGMEGRATYMYLIGNVFSTGGRLQYEGHNAAGTHLPAWGTFAAATRRISSCCTGTYSLLRHSPACSSKVETVYASLSLFVYSGYLFWLLISRP